MEMILKHHNIQYLQIIQWYSIMVIRSVSSCSPSRSALLTGLPVHQNGMYGY